jgi:release factor glutamine methyltransferase
MSMATVADSLQRAVRTLAGHSESPRLDAELLLGKVLGLSRSGLLAHDTDPLAAESRQCFAGLIERRVRGIPIAYLTGEREFWSLSLTVSPAVLVPRPETELLVEHALELLPDDQPCTVLDLGTGSGAIALAIASERPHARITAVDISAPALQIARGNALKLGLSQIDWRCGSWFGPVFGNRFDLIVANPPYVASGDPALLRLAAEPAVALTPGLTGLESFSMIVSGAAAALVPRGWLILEHGCTQAGEVARLLEGHGFGSIRCEVDYSGQPRITLATLHSSH